MSRVLVKGRLWAAEKALDCRATGEVNQELIFVTPMLSRRGLVSV